MTEPSEPDAPTVAHETAAAVVARLLQQHALAGGYVLATDADGTLWEGDVGVDVFEALLAADAVRDAATCALAAFASANGVEFPAGTASHPTAIARALYEAHKADRYPHDRAFAMMAWAFAGFRSDELAAFVARVLDGARLSARIRPEMRTILRWAAAERVPIYIVSASPIAAVEAAAAQLDVPVAGILAMTPAMTVDGVLLPSLEGRVVYGDGKVRALDDAGVSSHVLGAFGDSAYDAALLRIAKVPVAVSPTTALAALFDTIPGVVVLKAG